MSMNAAVKGQLFPENCDIIVATSATVGEHALITVRITMQIRDLPIYMVKPEYEDRFMPKFLFIYIATNLTSIVCKI